MLASPSRTTRTMFASVLWLALLLNGDWTSYRRDSNNSGAVPTTASFHGSLTLGWRYKADSRITSSPVRSGDVVYAGTWSGDVLAFASGTGRVLWKAHLGANSDEAYGGPRGVIGSVAVGNNVVFAASGNCTLAALKPDTGHFLWRTSICDNKRNDDVYASPVIAGSLVLIGVDIMEDRPTDFGRELALDAATGKVRWIFKPARYKGTGSGVSTTAALDDSARIAYVGSGNPTPVSNPPPGDDPGSDSIFALEVASGKTLWVFGPSHPHDTQDDDFFASPNRFHTRDGWRIGEGSKDGSYYTLDAGSGAKLWKTAVGSSSPSMIVGTPAVGHDTIFVSTFTSPESGSISALRARDGSILWSRQTGGEYEAPLLWGDTVFTTESTGWLDAFRSGTGTSVGRWKLCGKASGRGPTATQDTLYVASGNCLDAYHIH